MVSGVRGRYLLALLQRKILLFLTALREPSVVDVKNTLMSAPLVLDGFVYRKNDDRPRQKISHEYTRICHCQWFRVAGVKPANKPIVGQ